MKRLLQIAKLGLLLGATIFGGVTAAYPVIRERVVEFGELGPEDVDGIYALCVFLPGPSFLNLWGAISARVGGLPGAFVGSVALLLPAFLLVLLLPMAAAIPPIGARTAGAFNGAVWATAGLLIATGIEGVRKLRSAFHKWLAAVVLPAAFLGMHPTLLLMAVIGCGALYHWTQSHKEVA